MQDQSRHREHPLIVAGARRSPCRMLGRLRRLRLAADVSDDWRILAIKSKGCTVAHSPSQLL